MSEEEVVIRKFLREFRLRRYYMGYEYLVYGLLLLVEDPMLLTYIVKGLYVQIADKYGTKVACVEKNIRCLKRNIWRYNSEHPVFKGCTRCPKNADFMDILLYEIEARLREL